MPRLKLNGKLLLILLAGTAVLGIGVYTLHGVQVERNAEGLLVQAERAEKGGDLDRAEDYLDRYLRFRPDDVEGLAAYARVLEARGDSSTDGQDRLFRVYEKAVRLAGEGRPDLRRRLVDLAVALGEQTRDAEYFSRARPHVAILRRPAPDDGGLTFLLARCEEGTARFREAAALYEQARQQDPARIEAYTRLADLLRTELRDTTRADRVMDARQEQDGLIAHNGRSAAAFLARASYRRRYEVPGVDPADDVARALELAPDDAEVILAAAESARARGDLDAARGLLDRGVERHPGDAAIYQARADLELQDGRAGEAVDWLKQGDRALGDDETAQKLALGFGLANLLLDVGERDEARDAIARLEAANVRPELVEYLDARRLMVEEDWPGAARALAALQPRLAGVADLRGLMKQSLILLGRCHERLGDGKQRLDAYERAVAINLDPDPYWVEARMGYAEALAAQPGQAEAARTQYRVLIDREPAAGLALARLQIVQNLRRPAEERDWEEVGRTLDAAEPGLRDRPATAALVAILRAEVHAARGQLGPARQALEQALARSPDQVDLWIARANLAGREGDPGATLAVLDDAGRRLGDRIELRLARAAFWAARGGDEAPGALAVLEQGAEGLAPDGRARLWRELVAAYTRIGQDDRAEALLRRLAAQDPDDLNNQLVLFDVALRAGDEGAARAALGEIRRIEGKDGPLGHYGEAVLLIRRARQAPADREALDGAREHLGQVAARRPSWSRVPLALAEVEELGGNPEAAVPHYLKAILELGERSPAAVQRALRLLTEQNRLTEATRVIQELRDERTPLSGAVQRQAAQLALQSGGPARALDLVRETVSDQSNDPDELILLGQLRWANDQDAGPVLRRAVALAGDRPGTHLALILYLAGTDQAAEAEAAIQAAGQALPADVAPLVQAQGYEAIGDADRAGELYRGALAARPDDIPTLRTVAAFHLRTRRLAEAEPQLRRIVELGGAAPDAAWARRLLATVTAAGGGHQRALRALEILGVTSASEPGQAAAVADVAPEDLRTQAKILAMQPSRAQRRQAIAILQDLAGRGAGTAPDLHLLAQLHDADGDWPPARQRYQELLEADTKDPNYLADYIRALLRHDQADEAEAQLARLEQMAPGQPGVVEIRARVLVARGKAGEAVALLTELTRADESRVGAVARLLEQLGQAAEAEALYRRYVAASQSRSPEALLALAGFLGRQGRTGEALDLLDDRAWQAIPAEMIANASVVILYGARADDEAQRERVAQRLEEAIRKNPDAVSIQFDLANVRSLQGRYADAEAIYRAIHERDKTTGSPLNNLAWLLALQGGKADQALALAQQAISLEGETPDLLDTRALAYLAANQPDPAIRDLEEAIAVSPTADKSFHLARAYRMAGRQAEAAEAFEKARELGLELTDLHPLERGAYRELLDDPARR